MASLVVLLIARGRGVPLATGRAARGAVLYGLLGFGASYALPYYASVGLPAGTTAVIVAAAPLFTLLIAVVLGRERLSPRAVQISALRRNWALMATITVLADMSTAPTAGVSSTPQGARTPRGRVDDGAAPAQGFHMERRTQFYLPFGASSSCVAREAGSSARRMADPLEKRGPAASSSAVSSSGICEGASVPGKVRDLELQPAGIAALESAFDPAAFYVPPMEALEKETSRPEAATSA